MRNKILLACLAIALLEGFAGLGIEIYAIRISATYIGSSTSITGVILAMVLLAIAVGYWYGGKLSEKTNNPKDALLKAGNVLAWSAIFHAVACMIQLPLLEVMTRFIENPIISAVGVGFLFGGGLAFGSMSIPLITQFLTLQYKKDEQVDAGKNAGMMVAVTTVGSVLGSTITPIVLLPYIGLMSSLALFVTSLALSASVCTLLASYGRGSDVNHPTSNKQSPIKNYLMAGFAVAATIGFVITNKVDTGYQTATTAWFVDHITVGGESAVTISDFPKRSISSCWLYESKQNCSWYGIQAINSVAQTQSKRLAFLGGAGMAIPSEIAYKDPSTNITVIDIDKDLPDIVESYFLKEPIAENITFVGDDGRGYINRHRDIKYDFMFIDVFHSSYVASNLYTIEALSTFKQASTYLMANVIGKTDKNHGYTKIILKNWYEVFGERSHIITDGGGSDGDLQNLLLCNFACAGGTLLSEVDYLNKDYETHTDDMPRLDKYYYRKI